MARSDPGNVSDVASLEACQCLCGAYDATPTAISDRAGLVVSKMRCGGDSSRRWTRIETSEPMDFPNV